MAEDNSEKKDKGFTVVDRRIGGEEEESAKETEQRAASETEAEQETEQAREEGTKQREAAEEYKHFSEQAKEQSSMPPVTFPTFLLSLHTSALIQLGIVPDPTTGQRAVNPEVARQNIDLLEILKEKTTGNLDEEESRLLDNILYELRMAYVGIASGAAGKES